MKMDELNKIYIVGNTGFSQLLLRISTELFPNSALSICANKKYNQSKSVPNLEDVLESSDLKSTGFFVSVGYSDLNKARDAICNHIIKKGGILINIIHPSVKLLPGMEMGVNNAFLENCIIQDGVTIGDGNIINAGAIVSHHCKVGNYNWITGGSVICGSSIIKNHCFIGANATVKDNVVIESNNFIGMASRIGASTQEGEVYLEKNTLPQKFNSTDFIRISNI